MENMIRIKNVTKAYGDYKAVNDLDLNIEKGCFFGLLGPNGAGKTTLIKMLVGLLKPDNGKILVNEQEMHRGNTYLKKIIGIVPQYINLDKELTTEENMIFSAKLYKLSNDAMKERINELLKLTELEDSKNKLSKNLSGGMKRKLMIARAIIHDPEIVFMDEPTVGIDLNSRRKIWDILKTMKDMGKTVILTTHYIEEAEYLCDKIALMDSGKIFYKDTSEHLKSKLGKYTVEYFNEDHATVYKHFNTLDEAKAYAKNILGNYILRDTNLEDVFFNFTNRKVI